MPTALSNGEMQVERPSWQLVIEASSPLQVYPNPREANVNT